MKITVNGALCSGHGRCYDVGAPVFSPDDEGYCAERDTTFGVAPGLEAVARAGAAACPQGAVAVHDDAS